MLKRWIAFVVFCALSMIVLVSIFFSGQQEFDKVMYFLYISSLTSGLLLWKHHYTIKYYFLVICLAACTTLLFAIYGPKTNPPYAIGIYYLAIMAKYLNYFFVFALGFTITTWAKWLYSQKPTA